MRLQAMRRVESWCQYKGFPEYGKFLCATQQYYVFQQGNAGALYTGTAVVVLTRSSTKLVLQSCTLGCLSKVSMMKRL